VTHGGEDGIVSDTRREGDIVGDTLSGEWYC
jgi:hypothetical protein